MKKLILGLFLSVPMIALAQNPIIRDQFTADPTARVFNNKVYVLFREPHRLDRSRCDRYPEQGALGKAKFLFYVGARLCGA